MSDMENILPTEHQFNTSLAEIRKSLVHDLIDTNTHVGDIIDPKQEFSQAYENIWDLSGQLAELLKQGDEESESVRVAVYRAMCFGLEVVRNVKHMPKVALSGLLLSTLLRGDNPGDTVRDAVDHYLKDNPGLESLIFTFKSEIDDTYLYSHHVETTVGLTLLLCEHEQEEVYRAVQVQRPNTKEMET